MKTLEQLQAEALEEFDLVGGSDDAVIKARELDTLVARIHNETLEVVLEKVVNVLVEEGYLKGKELIPHDNSKKSHGGCCYCGTCGHDKDDCVCEHNRLLTHITRLKSETV
jgi:radical SAM superfamily enzyme